MWLVQGVSKGEEAQRCQHLLFLVDGLELHRVVRVLATAGRAAAVQPFLNMMPTEAADLAYEKGLECTRNIECTKLLPGSHTGKV